MKNNISLGTCLAIAVVFFFVRDFWNDNKSVDDLPIYEATVDQINAAFDANEVAAQQAVNNHRVKVTGVIEDFDLSMTDKPLVYLKGDSVFNNLHIEAVSTDEVARLHKGQTVTFIGINPHKTLGSVFIESARLWHEPKPTPAPASSVSTQQEVAQPTQEKEALSIKVDCKYIAEESAGLENLKVTNATLTQLGAACAAGAKLPAQGSYSRNLSFPQANFMKEAKRSSAEVRAFRRGYEVVNTQINNYLARQGK